MILKFISNILGRSASTAFLIIMMMMIPNNEIFAQNGWYAITNIQIAGGNFIYGSYANVVSLNGGLSYQDDNLGMSLSVPVVGNKNNSISQSGGMMLPIGNSANNNGGMTGGLNGGGMMGSGNSSVSNSALGGMNWGIGDLYLFSNYKLLTESESFLDIILNAQLKIPTASSGMRIGTTGQYDYGTSVTLRKSFDTFIAISDFGYLNIGDPSGTTYENPITYSFGFGKFFNDGEYSVLLYYSAYTEIVKNYEPPRQIALGINYKISQNLIITGIGSAGLSKFSPDYILSTGIKFRL